MSSNDRRDAPVDASPAAPRQRSARPLSKAQRVNGTGNGYVDPRSEASAKPSRPSTRAASQKRVAARTLVVAPDEGVDVDSTTDESTSEQGIATPSPTSNGESGHDVAAEKSSSNGDVAAAPVSSLASVDDKKQRLRDRRPLSGGAARRVRTAEPVTTEVSNIAALAPVAPSTDEPRVASPLVTMRPSGLAPDVTVPMDRPIPLVLPQPLVYDGDAVANEYPETATERAPSTHARSLVQFGPGGRRRRPRIRRVTRVVRHVDPWSVFKVALCFSVVLYGVCLTAGVLLWNVAYTTGTIDNIERFFESFGWDTFQFKGGELYHNAWIGGLFVAVGLTGLIVLAATLFNLITDLVGGIRVTVLEEEVVERHPAVARPLLRRRSGEMRIASETAPSVADDDDPMSPPFTEALPG